MKTTAYIATALLCCIFTVAADADTPKPRRNINDLMSSPYLKPQRDLLLLSLKAISEMPPDDPLSFFMIASIHGEGQHPYRGAENSTSPFNSSKPGSRWMGYCEHADVLFPVWHRPYVALLEKSIITAARKIALLYPTSSNTRAIYLAAANELRWPYWDWAASPVVPSFLLQQQIIVNAPLTKEGRLVPLPGSNATPIIATQASRAVIKNPFYSYTFQKKVTCPDNIPYYIQANYPYFPFYNEKGAETVRWPNAKNMTNVSNFNISFYANNVLNPVSYNNHQPYNRMVMDLLQTKNWGCFSNRGSQLADPLCLYQSLESVHNFVHLSIGGYAPLGGAYGGHMADLESAGFDPVFFLHHSNVDRLLALYQAFKPAVYVEDGVSTMGSYMYDVGQPLNITSPLWPFRIDALSSSDSGQFYTSVDVASTYKMGYYYDDINTLASYRDLYAWAANKYGGVIKGFRWWLYETCYSANPAVLLAGTFTVNVTYFPTPNSSGIPIYYSATPELMQFSKFNRSVINVSFSYELTTFMQANNITTNVFPIDDDYSKGPQFIPLYDKNIDQNCFVATATGIQKIACICDKKIAWSVDGPLDAPYNSYSGLVRPCKLPICT